MGLLGIDGSSVQPELGPLMTDALRKHIPSQQNMRVEVSPQDLVEIKLVFGCLDEKPACMAKVGKSLGVSRLIYGMLRKQPGTTNLTMTLKQLNVGDATVEKLISDSVPAAILTRDNPQLDALVQQWLRTLLIEGQRGGLRVETEPPGAMVSLDGVALGPSPLIQNDVEVGQHEVRVELPGYASLTKKVTVRGGMLHAVSAQLWNRSRLTGSGEMSAGARTDWGKAARISSYVLGGLAGVAAIAAIGTWRGYVSAEDAANANLDQLQRRLTTDGKIGDYRDFFTSSAQLSKCSAVGSLAGDADYAGYRDNCERGNSLATATTGLWVAAGGFAALSITAAIVARSIKKPEARPQGDSGAFGSERAEPLPSSQPTSPTTPAEGAAPAPAPAAPADAAPAPAAPPLRPAGAPLGFRLDSLAPVVAPTGAAVTAQFSF